MITKAVVAVHYGDPGLCVGLLQNLASVEPEPHHVIIVDHGPSSGLDVRLRGLHPSFTVLTDWSNPGFGAGCNKGAFFAFNQGAESIWFLNNDARLDRPVLKTLSDSSRKYPDVVLWGTHQIENGHLIGADIQPSWFEQGNQRFLIAELDCGRILHPRESLSGASIFVTRAGWDLLGPWPTDFFLYFEDAAWCQRAHRAGLSLGLLELAVAHPRGTTTGRRSPLTTFYGTRNRLLLMADSIPLPNRLPILREAGYLLQRRFFRGQWKLLSHTWNGIRAALMGKRGRDPRY